MGAHQGTSHGNALDSVKSQLAGTSFLQFEAVDLHDVHGLTNVSMMVVEFVCSSESVVFLCIGLSVEYSAATLDDCFIQFEAVWVVMLMDDDSRPHLRLSDE